MGRRLRGVRGEPPLPRGAHLDFSGDAIAAVGVSGSNADMPESEFETMAHSVVKAARNISLSMGYVM